MDSHFTYLAVLFGSFIVPFIFSFHPKIRFYKYFGKFIAGNVIVSTLFIFWDIWFTSMGVWGFNPQYVIGVYFFGLPLEEILFFVLIPFACSFTYFCFKTFCKFRISQRLTYLITIVLLFSLILLGCLNIEKWYTSVTFVLLAIAIFYFQWIQKPLWLSQFYWIYLILLIPFFITNGILTGTGLEQPVVWYNNSENLNFQIGTIPFEDIFYGFLMVILNIYFLEIKLSDE